MRKACLDVLLEMARRDERIVFIGSDLGVGTMARFQEEMPDRFFMEGISEAHIIGMAAGLALEGRIVYVNTIATFLTRRCFEQIVVDLCLHNANVRLLATGGGLTYAPLGPTHEAIEDLALLRPLPNMSILVPADADEMRRLMPATVEHQGPIYIRQGKGGDPIVTAPDQPFRLGQPYVLKPGSTLQIVSTGTTAKMALLAAERLEVEGLSTGVLHLPTIKPLDEAATWALLKDAQAVLSIEEHMRIGGLGSLLAELLAERGFGRGFQRLGLPDRFPDQYGSQASLMAHLGVGVEPLVQAALRLLGRQMS